MQDYVIQPQEEGKGRAFHATRVAIVTADELFPEAQGASTIRPVWAMFAGTDLALRPFVANLKTGRKAEKASINYRSRGGDGERLEFLRSVGYLTSWQREPEGCLVTVYHPELFRLDPGLVDPSGIRFVLMAPTDWSDAQRVDVASAVQHVKPFYPAVDEVLLTSLVPTAYLFAAYLDRRTRCPLVADGRFYLQLLVASLDCGLASLPGSSIQYHSNRSEWGHAKHGFDVEVGDSSWHTLERVGIQHAISFSAEHEPFEAFLAEQVTRHFGAVRGGRRARGHIDLSRFRDTTGA